MKSERITFMAKPDLSDKIEERAEELSLTKSEVVRRAVAEKITGERSK